MHSTKHRCAWPHCDELVARNMWGCKVHWYMLPSQLRSWIGRAYRQGLAADAHPTRYYVKAHQAALAWIAENCTTEDEHAR